MTEEQLKKKRIEEATFNHIEDEAAVTACENNSEKSEQYFNAMCRSIISEQIYDQVMHFYQQDVKVTKEEAKRRLKWQMRKRNFLINIHKAQIKLLEAELHEKWSPVYNSERMRIQQEIVSKYIAVGEMIRQANAFEFRTMLSIENSK